MKYLSALIFSLFMFTAHTQISMDAVQAEISKSAQAYLDAFVKRDFDVMAELTNKNIIDMGGGVQFFISDMVAELEQTTASGLKYISASIMSNDHKPYAVEEELHVVVPHDMIVTVNGNKYRSTSHILGTSSDDGSTWSYVNLNKYSTKSLQVYIPSIQDDFEIPRATPFEELR